MKISLTPSCPKVRIGLFLIGAILPWTCFGQENATAPVSVETPLPITVEDLEAQVATLQQAASPTEGINGQLLNLYQQALKDSRAILSWTEERERLQTQGDGLPQQIEGLKAELAQMPMFSTPEISDASALADLERIATERKAEEVAARTEAERVQQEISQLSDRRKRVPEELAALRQRLQEIQADQTVPAAPESPEVEEARLLAKQLKEIALQREIEKLEKENLIADNRAAFLNLRRDQTLRRLDRAEKLARFYERIVTTRRQQEAELAAANARLEAQALIEEATADPAVQSAAVRLASENAQLAEKRTGLLRTIETESRRQGKVEVRLNQVARDLESIKNRVSAAGLSNSIGQLLRRYKGELPDARYHRRNLRNRQETLSQLQIEQIELREIRDAFLNVEQSVAGILATVPEPVSPEARLRQESLIRELVSSKLELSETLLADYSQLENLLISRDQTERSLVEKTAEFETYIDEHVLWIPSGRIVGPRLIVGTWPALVWIADPERWRSVMEAYLFGLIERPIQNFFAVVILLLLVKYRRKVREQLVHVGKAAARPTCITMRPTLEAVVFTLLLSATGPAILAYFGASVALDVRNPDTARGVGYALLTTAFVCFSIELFRQMIREHGLAGSHYNWADSPRRAIRPLLNRLLVFTLPTAFVTTLFRWHKVDSYQETLGRLLFLISTGYFLYFVHQTLRPNDGPFQMILDFTHGRQRSRLRYVWYGLVMGLSAFIFGLTLLGYSYTAHRLGTELFLTLTFIVAVVLVYGVVLRWRFLAYRQLARERARRKRDLLKSKDEAENPEIERMIAEEEEAQLEEFDEQVQRVLRFATLLIVLIGVWGIWSTELPALSVFNSEDFRLWKSGETKIETVTLADGEIVDEEIEQWVTVGSLFLALVIAIITIGATRNLPGFLEIAFLQRLRMSRGERYAVSTVLRYVLIGIGTVLTFNALGVGWNKVQWLVAALSVGLGFGLQEIFANFVSGLIILFERPVRLGDVVTVGGVSGTVTKIQIRATTITDFDMKELIVPNKEFVTGQLVNWSLTDPTLRLTVPVGVAYGSDTRKAAELLARVAREEEAVLDYPEPVVLFGAFGASSLDFELRVYVQSVENIVPVRNRLHYAIDDAFREAGIEIAFPQQDVHLNATAPFEIRMLQAESGNSGSPGKET